MSEKPTFNYSTTPLPLAPLPPLVATIGQSIPYGRFLDCVHCGLCTSACPTYVETGDENDSPRGRIYLMRSVVDGRLPLTDNVRRHLDLCLDCRSCETACPSGVQYGRLIEPFRVEMHEMAPANAAADSQPETPILPGEHRPDWFHRWIMYGLFPYRSRMRWALKPARLMQRLGFDRLAEKIGMTRLLPAKLQRMQAQLPNAQAITSGTSSIPASQRNPTGSCRIVPRLRGRRHVSTRSLGDGPCPAGKRLRRCDSAKSATAAVRFIITAERLNRLWT